MTRYLAPVDGSPADLSHLSAACQVARRDGGEVVALVIGLVPHSLPMGSDVPDVWSRLEYEAARIPEYWLFDPLRREALFHVLGEDGRYHVVLPDTDGFYHSQVVEGFRHGRELGVEVESVLVLSDSAAEAVLQLVEECRATAVCLAYENGLRAALHRWRDPLWRTLMEEAPCPLVLERVRPAEQPGVTDIKPAAGQRVPLGAPQPRGS